jgi:hypothetical protein
MIWAVILQKQPGQASREIGNFGFRQLPISGDHIQILNERGLIDLMQVFLRCTQLVRLHVRYEERDTTKLSNGDAVVQHLVKYIRVQQVCEA